MYNFSIKGENNKGIYRGRFPLSFVWGTITTGGGADTIRAGEVAERVQISLGDPKITRGRKEVDKYSVAWHTKCWQNFKIRPPSGNAHPEQTEIKYCIYDKRHNDYGYTEEWVKFLVAKFKDEKAYKELFTQAGEPNT